MLFSQRKQIPLHAYSMLTYSTPTFVKETGLKFEYFNFNMIIVPKVLIIDASLHVGYKLHVLTETTVHNLWFKHKILSRLCFYLQHNEGVTLTYLSTT